MASKAKLIKKDGTTCIVTAKEAARIPRAERSFRCLGKDSNGNPCGSPVFLVKTERNGRIFMYFRGHEHIKGCGNMHYSVEVRRYIDRIRDFHFVDLFRAVNRNQNGPVPPPIGGGDINPMDDVETDEHDIPINPVVHERAPRTVNALYEILSTLPFDFVVDGKEVGEILITRETFEDGYTNLEGNKVMVVQRCKPPKWLNFDKTFQIVVRICGIKSTFLVLSIPEKELRQKVWNMIFPKKESAKEVVETQERDVLPQMLVTGNVSRLKGNIYSCEIMNSNVVTNIRN